MEDACAGDGDILRTVTMAVTDWERFGAAFGWLMEQATGLEGCRSIECYRSVEDPGLACIAEHWDSVDAIARGYERLGDVPWEFMRRAGEPEYRSDTSWARTDLPRLLATDP